MSALLDLACEHDKRFAALFGAGRGTPEHLAPAHLTELSADQERLLEHFLTRHLAHAQEPPWAAFGAWRGTSTAATPGEPEQWRATLVHGRTLLAARIGELVVYRTDISERLRHEASAPLLALCAANGVAAHSAVDWGQLNAIHELVRRR